MLSIQSIGSKDPGENSEYIGWDVELRDFYVYQKCCLGILNKLRTVWSYKDWKTNGNYFNTISTQNE